VAVSHVKSNTVADFTGTVTVANSGGGTNTIAATDLIRPSDWNSAHNHFVTITGNTAGTANGSGTNLVFGGTNDITLNLSTAAGGGQTLWINETGRAMSIFEPTPYLTGTAWSSHPASTYFQYFSIQEDLAFNNVWAPKSVSIGFPTGTSSATTQTVRHGYTHYFSLFSRKNYGNSYDSLSYMTHGSFVATVLITHSNTSIGMTVSFATDTTGGTLAANFSSGATANIAAVFNGPRMIKIPFPATTLTAGEYWIAQAHASSGAGTTATATTAALYSNLHQQPAAAANFAWFGTGSTVAGSSLNPWGPASRGVAGAITSNADMAGSRISGSVVNNWYCILGST
jgi:hypothetical protein